MSNLDVEVFVRTRAPGLLRRARLLTPDTGLAEDITQEALTQAVVHWRRVSRASDPDAYLNRVLVNSFMSAARRRSFSERPTDLAGMDHGTGTRTSGGSDEARVDLARALGELTPDQRVVMVLRHYDDLSVADVARELGRSEAWVRQTAHRASARLRSSVHLAGSDEQTTTPRRAGAADGDH